MKPVCSVLYLSVSSYIHLHLSMFYLSLSILSVYLYDFLYLQLSVYPCILSIYPLHTHIYTSKYINDMCLCVRLRM